ncbi:MAG TPA: YegS/Rv2252/BmrU family lipid kinase [Candidatus Limnocylindria bacterium]|nr:YegS/Rv2252/BmrU family lipid kinase [Candidatus Limnocylindria bacterium]
MNRRSRRTDAELDRVHEALAAHGLRVAEFHAGADEAACRRAIKRAVKDGAPEIVVGGGDGTMTHAVGLLAHRKCVLGVLPLGTGNSFAQTLGLPGNDVDAAVATIARGHVAQVDLGIVNGTYFANFATIGFSSRIAAATPRPLKSVLGSLAYALAGLPMLLRARAFDATIRWPGGRLALHTQDIIVANGRYFGATALSAHATIADDRLTLFTTADASRLGTVRTYLALGRGTQTHLRDAHLVRARRFTIRTRKRQPISIDGSLLEKTPARFALAPGALRVFVPETGVARA